MAKFKLRPELIPIFQAKGIIDGTGQLKMTLPWKQNRISGEKAYEVSFDPSTQCLQTTNAYTANVLRKRTSPRIKVNGSWFIDDPAVPWFVEYPDTDTTPAVVVEGDGVEAITRTERKILLKYLKENPTAAKPATFRRADAATAVANARSYLANKII